MSKEKEIEEFLINDKEEHYCYIDDNYSYNNIKFYKEKFNDRFCFIYGKIHEENKLVDNKYILMGYYDCINKVVYEPSYTLKSLLEDSKTIKLNYWNNLANSIEDHVLVSVSDYFLNNKDEFKNRYRENFERQEDYMFELYKQEVNEMFVKEEINNHVPIKKESYRYRYEQHFNFSDNQMYNDYLDNPIDTVSKICNWVISKDEFIKNYSIALLINEFQNNYLKEITDNKKEQFDYLYLNKKILNSISDIDAKNLNITIKYDDEELTFKFPKRNIVNDLELCKENSWGYGKYYNENIIPFLERHKQDSNYSYNKHFDFKNITLITYGKKILYEKEKLPQLEKDSMDMDEIEI